jgi:hypothetical protein
MIPREALPAYPTGGGMTGLYDIETEKCVLIDVLSRNTKKLEAALGAGLEPNCFFDQKNRVIFRAAFELAKDGKPIDHYELKKQLESKNQLDEVGIAYLLSLYSEVLGHFDTARHAGKLVSLARQRNLLSAAANLQTAANAGNGSIPAAVEDLQKALASYAMPSVTAGFQPPEHWELLDVAHVDNWQCEPLEWIIENVLAKGNLAFIAADSQCGKTLIALYVMMHILTGGYLFNKFKVNPVKKILYLMLEDPTRRAKKRILDMRRDLRIKPEQFMVYVAPGLTINDDAHFAWLKQFVITGGYDLVVIDTYQKATPGISSFDDIKQGPILHRLANLTRELSITLWIHDHYRKDGGAGKKRRELDISSLKGTGGKPQNADVFVLMERTGNQIKVLVSSKDSDIKPRFLLDVAPEGSGEEKFTYVADLSEASNDMRVIGDNNRQRVLDSFPSDGSWISRSFIEGATGLKQAAVKKHLQSLLEAKKIESNGKGSKAIRYRIGHAEMASWPNAVSSEDARD